MEILSIPFLTSEIYALGFCKDVLGNPVYNWLLYGRLPENPVVTPEEYPQYIEPSAKNRYLQSVTVLPVPIFKGEVTLGVDATSCYCLNNAVKATSSDTSITTAEISNGVVTVTGVANGDATITVEDSQNNTIATVDVTVQTA